MRRVLGRFVDLKSLDGIRCFVKVARRFLSIFPTSRHKFFVALPSGDEIDSTNIGHERGTNPRGHVVRQHASPPFREPRLVMKREKSHIRTAPLAVSGGCCVCCRDATKIDKRPPVV